MYNNFDQHASPMMNQWKSDYLRCAQAGIQRFEYEQQITISKIMSLNDRISAAAGTTPETVAKLKHEKCQLSRTVAELGVLIKYGYEEKKVLMETEDYNICMEEIENVQRRMNHEFSRVQFTDYNRPRA